MLEAAAVRRAKSAAAARAEADAEAEGARKSPEEVASTIVDLCTKASHAFGAHGGMGRTRHDAQAFQSELHTFLWLNLSLDGRGWLNFYLFEEGVLRAVSGPMRRRKTDRAAAQESGRSVLTAWEASSTVSRADLRRLFASIPGQDTARGEGWVTEEEATTHIMSIVQGAERVTADAALKSGTYKLSRDGRRTLRETRGGFHSEFSTKSPSGKSPTRRQSRSRSAASKQKQRDIGERAKWTSAIGNSPRGAKKGHWKARPGMFSKPVATDILTPHVDAFVARLFRAVNAGDGAEWTADGTAFCATAGGRAPLRDREANPVQRAVNAVAIATFPPERAAPLHVLVPPAEFLRELARCGFARLEASDVGARKEEHAWKHPSFARGRPDQLSRIKAARRSVAAQQLRDSAPAVRYTPDHIFTPLRRDPGAAVPERPQPRAGSSPKVGERALPMAEEALLDARGRDRSAVEIVAVVERKLRASLYTFGGSGSIELLFRRFNTTLDGMLSLNEFRIGVRKARIAKEDVTDDDVEQIFHLADTDGDGLISLEEMSDFMQSAAAPDVAGRTAASPPRPLSPLMRRLNVESREREQAQAQRVAQTEGLESERGTFRGTFAQSQFSQLLTPSTPMLQLGAPPAARAPTAPAAAWQESRQAASRADGLPASPAGIVTVESPIRPRFPPPPAFSAGAASHAVHIGRNGSISISPAAAPPRRVDAPPSLPARLPEQLSEYGTALLHENEMIAQEIEDLHAALGDDLSGRFARG